jgi:hypothetical protein
MLHPYIGTKRDEHMGPDGKGAYSRDTYGVDRSKAKTYYFNSLGFRGEELDPAAPVKLFVCGCSHTFGVGLELEESWPFLFKLRLAEQHGLSPSSVNLMNFAEGGASNDYITRTLIAQSARLRPDVIVAGFTAMNRFELLDETKTFALGWGAINKDVFAERGYEEIGRLGEFIFLGTDKVQEKVRMIKNVLLLQYFCRSRDIPLVFFFFEAIKRTDLPATLCTPTTRALFEQIDLDALVPTERTTRLDRAADGKHAGPRSHELMAEAAWDTFSARYAQPVV